MTPLFSYFLQGPLVTAIFLLFYKLLLRRDTFFKWSRWYFIAAITCSFVLPLMDVSALLTASSKQQTVISYLPDLSFSFIAPAKNLWYEFAVDLLFAGIIVMMIRLLLQMIALHRLRKNKRITNQPNFRIVELDERINPFSFFNEIYINPGLHSQAELDEIIKHEQFHIQQKHTLDILLGEILTIAFWFNPFAWLLKNELKQNLEFLTDKLVLQSGIDAKHYQYNLLKVSGLQNNIAAANHFHFLKLKNRIIMMNKQQTHPYRAVKFLLLVPVVAALLLAFTERKEFAKAFTKTILNDTVPPPPVPEKDVNITIVNAPTTPVPAKDKPLPDNVKQIEVNRSNGLKKVTVTLKNGKKEIYDLNNAGDKKRLEEKYGSLPAPMEPLAAIAPVEPLGAIVPAAAIAPLEPLAAIAPISAEPSLPANIKSLKISRKDKIYTVTVLLRDGKKEVYDFNNAEDKKRYEQKYGELPVPPPPPPAPEKIKQTALNLKGYFLSVADDDGECVVIVKDQNKTIVEAVKLTDWDKAKAVYEKKYGAIPPATPKVTAVTPNANASKNGPGNPYTTAGITFKTTQPQTFTDKLPPQYSNSLVIVDGVKQNKGNAFNLNSLDPNTIASISILKDKAAIDAYGDEGKDGVIIIKTKKNEPTTTIAGTITDPRPKPNTPVPDPLYIVDGKVRTKEEINTIQPASIESVSVLKAEQAIAEYGEKGKNGVVLIVLKK